jgi:hypothetical protein
MSEQPKNGAVGAPFPIDDAALKATVSSGTWTISNCRTCSTARFSFRRAARAH